MSQSEVKLALKAQLETDLFLGGKWLPVPPTANSPVETGQQVREVAIGSDPAEASVELLEEKQQQLALVAQQVSQCTKCQLHQTRTRAVPGEVFSYSQDLTLAFNLGNGDHRRLIEDNVFALHVDQRVGRT